MAHTFIRVRDRVSGAEFDIAESAYRESKHIRVNATRQYPPLVAPDDRRVSARPAKHRTDKAGEPVAGSGVTENEESGR